MGKKKIKECKAIFKTKYASGTLTAVAYDASGKELSRRELASANGKTSIAVKPEVETANIDVKESDIKMDVYHSSGAGGQSVNTANSAVRLTHIPTGIIVYSQTERSQIKNKEKAIKILQTRLYDYYTQQEAEKVGAERRSKIGTGDRSEKIRTYNYPQNRVTDHRIGFTLKQLDRVMEGKLGSVIEALIAFEQKRALSASEEK